MNICQVIPVVVFFLIVKLLFNLNMSHSKPDLLKHKVKDDLNLTDGTVEFLMPFILQQLIGLPTCQL